MKLTRRSLILAPLMILLLAGQPGAATAQPASQSGGWEPGNYSGWVFFSAKLYKTDKVDYPGGSLKQDTLVYWQFHGDLDVRIAADGNGAADVGGAMEVTATEYGAVNIPQWPCSGWSVSTRSDDVIPPIVKLVMTGPLGDTFEDGITFEPKPAAPNKNFQGDCGSMEPYALFINDTVKNTSSFLKTVRFSVGYRQPLTVGGTCEIPDWDLEMGTPLGGMIQRELETCEWRVFLEP